MFGHLFEADDFVGAGSGQLGDLRDVGNTFRVAGVDQPVADTRPAEEDLRQLGFAVLTALLPIVLRLRVLRQPEQWRAVSADGEAELGVESGVEVGQGLGVGFVERVLEPAPVPRREPAAVHVLIDQWYAGDVLGQRRFRHTLHAIRNLSASCSRLRWA